MSPSICRGLRAALLEIREEKSASAVVNRDDNPSSHHAHPPHAAVNQRGRWAHVCVDPARIELNFGLPLTASKGEGGRRVLNPPRTLLLTPHPPLRLHHVSAPQPQGECARTWPAALRSLDRGVRWRVRMTPARARGLAGGESGTKLAPRALALTRWTTRRRLGVQVRERQAPAVRDHRLLALARWKTRGWTSAARKNVSLLAINTTFPRSNLGTGEALGFEGPPTPPPDSEPYVEADPAMLLDLMGQVRRDREMRLRGRDILRGRGAGRRASVSGMDLEWGGSGSPVLCIEAGAEDAVLRRRICAAHKAEYQALDSGPRLHKHYTGLRNDTGYYRRYGTTGKSRFC
ncbi:hypothetical protein DFH09DRAFT_1080526 [Mycena vulgaris]|nr:hypothetical protein DFH09DRAFT_1080526 [Mycena vulgaris]